ncbi:MAG TPA: inosine/xanthosine triphosphatase [Candidatus Acidoferrales bacterium]|nr:inosine/xanthosine triphosphatase [Candidatus Acidoferrales bacterium]
MDKIFIAVGSTRRPKLNAVWEALSVVGPTLDSNAQFEVVGVEVPSGVRHTPLSRDDMMAGARQRAEALVRMAREKGEPWKYFVGLEGGLDVIHESESGGDLRRVFLENWAYVTDGAGHGTSRGAFGQSGAVLLPEALVARVVDEGVELAEAIDAFAGAQGIRDAQGAWGILTRNMITRQDAFRTAVINAFAPFFNRALYAQSACSQG